MNISLRTDPSGLRIRWSEEAEQQYREAGYWLDETLVDAARRALKADPDRVMLVEGDRRLTRREAWNDALKMAAFFRSRGLRSGDMVSFQLPNWVEAAVFALAARMLGLVINPIPPIYRESEVGYILKDSRSKLVCIPHVFRRHDHLAMVEAMRGDLPDLRDILIVRGEPGFGLRYEDAMAFAPLDEADLPKIDAGAVMMVMYTSGTTGRPKGVMHTHYTYDYRVRSMAEAWSVGPSDVVFMPSPVTHITGAYWEPSSMPWVAGSSAVLLDVWSPDAAIDSIRRQRLHGQRAGPRPSSSS